MRRSTKIVCSTSMLCLGLGLNTAHALTVDYSFTNTVGNVAGTVTGQIEGLVDNATSAATAVFVDSYPPGLTAGASYPVPFNVFDWTGYTINENSFTLSNGVITAATFSIVGANGDNDQLYLNSACSCIYMTGHTNFLDIGTNDSLYVWNTGNLNAPDGLIVGPAIGAVPLPASAPLFGAALLALGAAGYGLKRKVKAEV